MFVCSRFFPPQPLFSQVFSMLAFKNDIQFWRQNESMKEAPAPAAAHWKITIFYGKITIFMGKSPFLWENHHFYGKITIFMGNSPFLWENHHFYGKITIFMGKSPFLWENHHFYGKLTIFMGKSPFLWENHHFYGKITIFMGKSPFLWENHHFYGKITIFMGKSPFLWENHHFYGKIHYFDWAMFNCYLYVHQRAPNGKKQWWKIPRNYAFFTFVSAFRCGLIWRQKVLNIVQCPRKYLSFAVIANDITSQRETKGGSDAIKQTRECSVVISCLNFNVQLDCRFYVNNTKENKSRSAVAEQQW